jgi:hypothetical protein
MTLFIKRFKKVMKKDGYFNKDKRRSKIKRKSCFGCGEVSHFIVDCPNPKNKNKSEKKEYGKGKKKYSGEAHLIQEWDSSEESSSDDECVATMAVEAHIIKSSLFEDLTDDEDDSTCFMAKGAKVDSKSNSNDDNDDTLDDNEHENMIKELGKKATSKIMKLMIEIKDKDETPEQQEEFIRLEREKTVGLEKSLSKERKSFKVQEDLLKAKINKILELEESLAKEKEKVVKLTKELFLVNESNAQLKGANETLHKNFLCLHAKHMDLEVEHDPIKESTSSSSNNATKSFISITSNGCTKCSNINVEACATNLAEMLVLSSRTTRCRVLVLVGLFLEEWYPFKQRLIVSNLKQAHIKQMRKRSTPNTQARSSHTPHKACSMRIMC